MEVGVGRGSLHAVRVRVVVPAEEAAGDAREGVLVAVHLVEHVDGVVERAAGLDGLVGAGFGAEAAIHADAEVDLVAVDVPAAFGVLAGGDEDAAIGACLGAGAAAGAALFEPEEVGARVDGDVPRLLRVLEGGDRAEERLEREAHAFGDAGAVGHVHPPPGTFPAPQHR